MARVALLIPVLLAFLLSACGRSEAPEMKEAAQEAAKEAAQQAADAVADKAQALAERKATELMLEQQANRDGGKVKVTIGDDESLRTEGVDKDGKPVFVHVGLKDLSALDAGVPIYPGSEVGEKGASRIRNDKAMNLILPLTSADAPEKVSAFYRAELAKLQGVKERLELPAEKPGSLHVMLSYPDPNVGITVMVSPAKEGGGSEVLLTRSTPN